MGSENVVYLFSKPIVRTEKCRKLPMQRVFKLILVANDFNAF